MELEKLELELSIINAKKSKIFGIIKKLKFK